MVNFGVGQTFFQFRLLSAAHTFGIVVIAVTTRPVVAVFLCKSKGCGEHLRTSAAVIFNLWFVDLFSSRGDHGTRFAPIVSLDSRKWTEPKPVVI